MHPDLLVASARHSELGIAAHDLHIVGPMLTVREPMDALWLSADDLVVAGQDQNGRPSVARIVITDRRPAASAFLNVGALPCALRVIAGLVFAACYSGGRVDALAVSPAADGLVLQGTIDVQARFLTGSRVSSGRQGSSHPHDVVALDDGGGRALVCDLGADRLYIIDTRELRIIDSVELPEGSGPRKALVGPGGVLVVVCELDSTIRCFSPAAGQYVQTDWCATTRHSREGNYPGDLVEPEPGLFVVANRGRGTLVAFRVNGGHLHRVFEEECGGQWPASLDAREGRVVVANEHSGSVVLFDVSTKGLTMDSRVPWRAPSLVRFAP